MHNILYISWLLWFILKLRYQFNATSQLCACVSAITHECEQLRLRVRVKLLTTEVVTMNQFISRVIASIYSSSKAKCFSIK